MARISPIHALLVVTPTSKWDRFHMDIKNVFLNGNLSEEVYMQPPSGLSIIKQGLSSLTCTLWP